MFPLWATTLLALFILLFAVPACAMAVVIWVRIIKALVDDLLEMNREQLIGDAFTIVFLGGFAVMFGWGAFELGSTVIDGLIGRYVDAFFK